ncbi:MAG: hypothetical protein IT424_14140 [Pirellulales bacterium]|nr:hypothetical protein [Pirellulales bacterium]
MIPRKMAMPVLLAASAAGPYVASHAPQWAAGTSAAATEAPAGNFAQPTEGSAAGEHMGPAYLGVPPSATAAATTVPVAAPATSPIAAPTARPGGSSYSIGEVFRFDVTKQWVYQRWARKSTALADLDLFGVRVPLVTGTALYDLAGSLTYFFGPDGRVKRISFQGKTGDTTQVVSLVVQHYGLQAQRTVVAGEQLFQLRDGDKLISELWTVPAPVLWSNSPHESFRVELELQDPAAARPLASRASAIVAPLGQTTTTSSVTSTGPTATNPTAASTGQSAPPTKGAAAAESAATDDAPLGWKALFPRSRTPKAQIRNLDQRNLYQW